jgi:hypothetical protein
MRLIPYTFNNLHLNDRKNLNSKFTDPHSWSLTQVDVNLIQRGGAYPAFGGVNYNAKTFSIEIFVQCSPETYSETLKSALNTSPSLNQSPKKFVAIDSASGKRVSIMCYPVNLVVNDEYGKSWTATFVAPDPEWKTEKVTTASKVYTASGQTMVINYKGNVPVRPTVTITPNTIRTAGYPYYRYVTLGNLFTTGVTAYILDVSNGGIDTATPIGAGKMRTDGNDLRVYDNGILIDRWLSGINTASTKIWTVLNFSAPITTLKLGGTIANTGAVTTITLKKAYSGSGRSRVFYLDGLPKSGLILIGSEQFYYSSTDVKNGVFTISQRAARGTSMAAHADADAITWIEHDIKLIYGNSTETAQQVNDDMAPVINLSTSTNSSWVYSNFGNVSGAAPGSFKQSIIKRQGDQTQMYTVTQLDVADTFTAMGMSLQSFILSNKWHSADGSLAWVLTHPAGITTVTSSGKIYRTSTSWPNVVQLQKMKSTTWIKQFNLTSPTVITTWEAWSKPAEALGATYKQIRFIMSGAVGALAENQVNFEVGAVTLTLDGTKVPTVTVGAEQSTGYNTDMNLNVTGTFENAAVSDSLYVKTPVELSENIVIDCDSRTAVKGVGVANILSAVSADKIRSFMLLLYPGNNTITLTESGLANVTVSIAYQEAFN